jgi:hypothetical protein
MAKQFTLSAEQCSQLSLRVLNKAKPAADRAQSWGGEQALAGGLAVTTRQVYREFEALAHEVRPH